MKLFTVFFLILCSGLFGQSIGGTTSGTAAYCNATNSGFISLNNHTGIIVEWQTSINNGTTWTSILNPTATQSYNNVAVTTWYRAIVQDGSFPADTSTVSTITIHPPAIAGTINGGGAFCSNSSSGTLSIVGMQGSVVNWESSVDSGATWSIINSTSTSYNYPTLLQPTIFRAIVSNIAMCPNDTTNSVAFQVSPPTNAGMLASSDTICNGENNDTIMLSNYVGAITNWESSTNNGVNWTSIAKTNDTLVYNNLTNSIWYRVNVQSGICPAQISNIVKLFVVNPEEANAGEDKTIIQYKETTLSGSGNGSASWSPSLGLSNTQSFTSVANPYNTTTYTLTLTDKHGCITKDSVTITVIIPIPSAFTPNNDGVNDLFIIDKVNEYPNNVLTITNRWGMEVYKASPYKNTWNGNSNSGMELSDDIYYYSFDYGDGQTEVASGFILIKR